jgi:hypothetical protein
VDAGVKINSVDIIPRQQSKRGIPAEKDVPDPHGKAQSGRPITIIYKGYRNAYFPPLAFIAGGESIDIGLHHSQLFAVAESFNNGDVKKIRCTKLPIGGGRRMAELIPPWSPSAF